MGLLGSKQNQPKNMIYEVNVPDATPTPAPGHVHPSRMAAMGPAAPPPAGQSAVLPTPTTNRPPHQVSHGYGAGYGQAQGQSVLPNPYGQQPQQPGSYGAGYGQQGPGGNIKCHVNMLNNNQHMTHHMFIYTKMIIILLTNCYIRVNPHYKGCLESILFYLLERRNWNEREFMN